MIKIQRRALCLFLILLLAVLPGCTSAQAASDMLESRVSRLETENYQLRSLLNRLESQINSLSQLQPRTPGANRSAPPVPPRGNRQVSSADPMFDRLATLAIELKQRVSKL
ncbi:MAG TPA: hypothetical protein V6D12_12625, partial [Candidatus Obscuribacterales bacterium]